MLLLRWLINTLALLVVAWLVEGIRINGLFQAFVASAFIGLLNVFIRPFLLLVTLPLSLLTLGLFTFVINGLMLLLASSILAGFQVDGFWTAVWGAFLLSIVSWLMNSFLAPSEDKPRVKFFVGRFHSGRPAGQGGRPPKGEELIDLNQDEEGKWS